MKNFASVWVRDDRGGGVTMPKWTVTIAANVRAYATVEIDAADEDAAARRADQIACSEHIWREPEMEDVVFNPQYDTIDDFESLEDVLPVVEK